MKEVLDSFHTIVSNVSKSALFAGGVCRLRRTTTSPTCWRPCEPSSRRAGAPTTFFQRARPPIPTATHINAETWSINTHTNTHLQCTHERTFKTQTSTNTHHQHTHETLHSLLINGVCDHMRVGRVSRRDLLRRGGPGAGAALLVGSCVVSVSPSALDGGRFGTHADVTPMLDNVQWTPHFDRQGPSGRRGTKEKVSSPSHDAA